jgi:hypothetical protein
MIFRLGLRARDYAFMLFLLLMPVFPQALFTLVGCHLMPFSLLTAWHIITS